MSGLYLIKRGPRPECHHAPFHPVIICGKRRVAKWEAGWTGDASWVWSHERGEMAGGWLLERWRGFDIDYGHVVRGVLMPDGTDAAFSHEHNGLDPWPLIPGAVWFDDRPLPKALDGRGVIYPPDKFTQETVLRVIGSANDTYPERPSFWPEPAPLEHWEVEDGPRIPNGAAVDFTEGVGCYATPATGVVVGLVATFEQPNGRWMDEYHIRLADGKLTIRYREHLEKQNADRLRHPQPARIGRGEA